MKFSPIPILFKPIEISAFIILKRWVLASSSWANADNSSEEEINPDSSFDFAVASESFVFPALIGDRIYYVFVNYYNKFHLTNVIPSGTLPVPIVLTNVRVFMSITSILSAFELATNAYNPFG